MENRVRFKFGEIEFEAEGNAEVIERERDIFMNKLLPSAIEAVVKTRSYSMEPVIEERKPLLIAEEVVAYQSPISDELSRTSLSSFLVKYGNYSEQDFVLLSAYYDEVKNNNESFTSETVKKYYAEARRKEYSNVSELLRQLAKKGLIMDAPNSEEKGCKQYILTADGIDYIKNYVPKKDDAKPKKSTRKVKTTIQDSRYASLNADCLKPEKYVDVCSLGKFLDQMIMVMYIVTKEDLGEWFTTEDVQYLLTKILGIPATKDQVNGVYKRNKKWFDTQKDTNNPKANAYKLLDGGKKHAESLLTK